MIAQSLIPPTVYFMCIHVFVCMYVCMHHVCSWLQQRPERVPNPLKWESQVFVSHHVETGTESSPMQEHQGLFSKIFYLIHFTFQPQSLSPPSLSPTTPSIHTSQRERPPVRSQQRLAYWLRQDQTPTPYIKVEQAIPR